ncbi:MAG: PilT/PilU family type 4a pilus ATPase [Planctomycetes bacterium]|nr:PilT/PilU family type 4a pilus ATPase [Planctomycetota bacterium]
MRPEDLIRHLVQAQGSDLIIRTNARPSVRIDGKVRFVSDIPVSPSLAQEFFDRILDTRQQELFFRQGEADAAYEVQGLGRFRVNVFRQRGKLGFVFRHVKSAIPVLQETCLPLEPLTKLCRLSRGLVLVTGTAGSGKSTTLAAMLDWINKNEQRHIITLEDPVEFQFEDIKSTFNQREVGVDTTSFAAALKSVVRQAPDVIMVGEMRDEETVAAVLQAAETGHLVFSTLHTTNAVQTVERILSFFPPHHHNLIRMQLAMLLEGVVSQRLLPKRDGVGRAPAAEILLATPSVREMLSEGRTRDLTKAITEGHEHYGSQSFNQSLAKLVKAGKVNVEDALGASDNADGLKLELRGIVRGARVGTFESGAPGY